MLENKPDFAGVLAALTAADVRFVLVGGLAMVSHGSAHITQDIDIAYSRAPENLASLAKALQVYRPRLRGLPTDLPFVLDARTLSNAGNLTLETDVGAVDLLGDITSVSSFEDLWERAVEMDLGGGLSVRVASLDDLIAMKRAADRPKDRLHLMELEALRRLVREEA